MSALEMQHEDTFQSLFGASFEFFLVGCSKSMVYSVRTGLHIASTRLRYQVIGLDQQLSSKDREECFNWTFFAFRTLNFKSTFLFFFAISPCLCLLLFFPRFFCYFWLMSENVRLEQKVTTNFFPRHASDIKGPYICAATSPA